MMIGAKRDVDTDLLGKVHEFGLFARLSESCSSSVRWRRWAIPSEAVVMSRDLLDRMRRNPAADWTISDVEALCREPGLRCAPPSGGGRTTRFRTHPGVRS